MTLNLNTFTEKNKNWRRQGQILEIAIYVRGLIGLVSRHRFLILWKRISLILYCDRKMIRTRWNSCHLTHLESNFQTSVSSFTQFLPQFYQNSSLWNIVRSPSIPSSFKLTLCALDSLNFQLFYKNSANYFILSD